jgi:flavodoxin
MISMSETNEDYIKRKNRILRNMKSCVLYFSRTGNTKRLAEAIADMIKASLFDIASSEPSIVENYDLLLIGTPVEGASPAKEARAFVRSLPNADGKEVILFCTHRIFGNKRTLKALKKELDGKGYKTLLGVTKRGMKPDQPADFSDSINKIQKALEK